MSPAPDQPIPASDLPAVRCVVEAIRLAADTDGSEDLVRLCNALLHETTQYVLAVTGGPASVVSAPDRAAVPRRRATRHAPHRSAPPASPDDPAEPAENDRAQPAGSAPADPTHPVEPAPAAPAQPTESARSALVSRADVQRRSR